MPAMNDTNAKQDSLKNFFVYYLDPPEGCNLTEVADVIQKRMKKQSDPLLYFNPLLFCNVCCRGDDDGPLRMVDLEEETVRVARSARLWMRRGGDAETAGWPEMEVRWPEKRRVFGGAVAGGRQKKRAGVL
ncbi:hypothetical protein QJS10_CPB12g00789 [Acorus calamus]|uniref:Uncharacterized protein n=1 Tax=Acorus calamus TaxID=4465 RepID=A0AAV9DKA1_ACOCL|nr:hypothetical protein QJS10_CPB12g00789 [Acorus calamus]